MSAFEVCVTPNRKKIERKTGKSNIESREPTHVTFGPFSGRSTVTFENVPVTKTAKRILIIQNQTDKDNKILVTRGFRPEYNIKLEWTSYIIPAKSEVPMEISWTPLSEFSCRETLQLTDSRNFQKDITVILKSIKATNGSKKQKHTNGGQNNRTKATLKMKSPTGIRNSNNKRSLKKIDCYDNNFENRPNITYHKEVKSPFLDKNPAIINYENKGPQTCVKMLKKGKENVSPISPCNASTLFDKIQFTPVADKKSNELEYLASLPTPGSRTRSDIENYENNLCPTIIINPPKDEINTFEKCKLNFEEMKEEEHENIFGTPRYRKSKLIIRNEEKNKYSKHHIESIFEHTNTARNKTQVKNEIDNQNQNNRIINETFEVNEIKSDSMFDISTQREQQTVLNRTTVISANVPRSLSVIEEDENDLYTSACNTKCLGETFKVSPKNVHRVTDKNLRKFSESMKDLSDKNLQRRSLITNQGSMPNLSDIANLNPITENRYYDQDKMLPQNDCQYLNVSNGSVGSVSSVVDVVFNQNEILAASSRFNVYDIGTNSVKRSPKFLKPRHKSVSPSSPVTPPPKYNRISLTPNVQRKTVSTPSLTPTPYKKRIRRCLSESQNMEADSLDAVQSVCLVISPPKRTKYDYTSSDVLDSKSFCNSSSNINKRVNQWSVLHPKKYNFSGTNLTPVRSSVTSRKDNKPEFRDVLYEPGMLFHACINPDPFAATTTCDPFITETMYLDERAVARHEMQIKKWLNALVSIPAEFDSDCNQKIDVGHLFNEVRNKELTLAPTKEQQSVNYLTSSRMEALRAAAVKLFCSPELTEPCCKIVEQIRKQSLRIRKDRDLHLDVVLQREMLELLLCFNPLWLRIGLEVVFSERITLQSNTDVVGLSSFIIHRLFRDKYIEQKHPRAYTLSEKYSEFIKKFMLQKFLFLLLFLDKAKEKRIIKHNPCLFVKSSPYKETREVLLRFSSELIASVGDITRMLRRYGYCLTHKQSYLDEFNYAFNNLAVDLRDGVRLTRVMEIILLRDDLTKQLRVPAISRLQRIYNVNLALKALSDAEFQLKGNIAASDIVDGHREKTLSLLWQIIYKFRAPKFNEAAATIQKWWRKLWLKVVIERRIRYKEEAKRDRAATKIQSLYRGYMARKYAKQYRIERENATVIIQRRFRSYLLMKEQRAQFTKIRSSAIIIQRRFRAYVAMKVQREKYWELREAAVKIQIYWRASMTMKSIRSDFIAQKNAAVIIQRRFRSYLLMKEQRAQFTKIRSSAIIIQRRFRAYVAMKVQREKYLELREAAVKIQIYWRASMTMKSIRSDFIAQKNAAVIIQRRFRSYLLMKEQRAQFTKIRSSAIIIQRRFRAYGAMKVQREKYLELREAAVKIQIYWRASMTMKSIRSDFIAQKNAAVIIQKRFRSYLLMKEQRAQFTKIRSSAIIIQRRFRAYGAMKVQREKYLKLREAAVKIQIYWRASMTMKSIRSDFIAQKNAAVIIQRRFKSYLLMKEQRAQFTKIRSSAIIIQRRFRAYVAMKVQREKYLELREAAVKIQIYWRASMTMKSIRSDFIAQKNAAVIIQRRFRNYSLMKEQRAQFLKIRSNSIIIQRRFRAYVAMKVQREKYLKLREAAVKIQIYWRASMTMKSIRSDFIAQKNAAVIIQRRFRSYLLKKEQRAQFTKIRSSAIIIQRRFRAYVAMKVQREKYLELREAAVKIQIFWRASMTMKSIRSDFIAQKNAAVIIQRRFRSYLLMKEQRAQFTKIRSSAIIIQRRFRAYLAMKVQREKYLKLREAAVKIQIYWRASMTMKSIRSDFIAQKNAAVIIQRCFRNYLLMKEQRAQFLKIRSSAIIIQRRFRAYVAMKVQREKYLKLREAAVKIQIYWRASMTMKSIRSDFIAQKNAAVIIQRRFRSYLLMKEQRAQFTKIRSSAIIIQRRFLAYVAMKVQREEYLKLRASVIIVQQRFRALLEMKKVKFEYEIYRQKIIIVQRRYRAKKLMEKERTDYLKLKAAAIVIQRRFRAKLIGDKVRRNYEHLKKSIVGIQAYARGYIARKQFEEIMTPERREFIRQSKAAIVIQRYWRGHLARKRLYKNYKIVNIRSKIRNLRNDTKSQNTVYSRVHASIKFLKGRFNVQETLAALIRLENISHVLPNLLMEHSEHVSIYCYGIMAQAIRSEIDKQLIELCSRIILNMARYDCTTVNTFQENGLVTIAQMLLRWCDKECGIFNTLCTLIWIFGHYPDKRRKIREFMTTHDALYMLRETKKLLLRKENMKKNVRKSSILSTSSQSGYNNIALSPQSLPHFEPDFGVVRNKPYIFIDSVFGFECVLNILEIEF